MLTVRAVVLKHHIKPDKSVRVKIVLAEGQKRKFIDCCITVSLSDLTKKLKFKNPVVIDNVNSVVKSYRERINKIADRNFTFEQIYSYLTTDEEIDFLSYAKKHIEKLDHKGRKGAARNRRTAINALKRFTGKEVLPISSITTSFLSQFEAFIRMNPILEGKTLSRAVSLYMGEIRTIHNEIKKEVNQEDIGLIKVPYSPFVKYKIPKENTPEKRALSVERVREIFSLHGSGRGELALDCFKISFFLIGMNAADLYNCSVYKDGYIIYNRTKTASRRADKAEIMIKVVPEVEGLIDKYRDRKGKRVFNFYQRYASVENFNHAISKGMKSVLSGVTFYSARHSWASIALNDVRIDKYTVHSALNHVDEAMRITDIYIKKDFTAINEANRKVIDFVFVSACGLYCGLFFLFNQSSF